MRSHDHLIGGFVRRLGTALVLTAMAVTAAVTVAPGTANAAAPGGRSNFTVALMRNVGEVSFVQLAQYSLRTDGTARSDYWSWHAQAASLNTNVASGFTSTGCAQKCTIWTADGFQDAPRQRFGTWSVSGEDLSITWPPSDGVDQVERWRFTNLPTITKVDLVSHQKANWGWGWGSTTGFRSGLSAKQVFNERTVLNGRYVQNNFGQITPDPQGPSPRTPATTSLRLTTSSTLDVRLCNDHCIKLTAPGNADKTFIAGSGVDRRMYYNHERDEVQSDRCIVKGHLKPALQVLDDNGAFRGLIMVEASVYVKSWGHNILGIYDLNNIE